MIILYATGNTVAAQHPGKRFRGAVDANIGAFLDEGVHVLYMIRVVMSEDNPLYVSGGQSVDAQLLLDRVGMHTGIDKDSLGACAKIGAVAAAAASESNEIESFSLRCQLKFEIGPG